MRSGGCPAGSGRALRLDPFALPLSFAASDAAADERVRHVELYRERVVVRRSLAGMRMALNMPVSAFAGIAIRHSPGEDGGEATVSVVLEHKDPSLALPLFVSAEADDAFAAMAHLGHGAGSAFAGRRGRRRPCASRSRASARCVSNASRPRRRRHNAIKRRRPSMPLRRRAGKLTDATPVHRGEREIIARN